MLGDDDDEELYHKRRSRGNGGKDAGILSLDYRCAAGQLALLDLSELSMTATVIAIVIVIVIVTVIVIVIATAIGDASGLYKFEFFI